MYWHKFHFLVRSVFYIYVYLKTANCLFEDQVGKFDWRQQYIGKVKFTYIDPTIAGTHKFLVATEENALGCLSTRTGSIIWRQVLEKDEAGKINSISEEGELITINGDGQFIRSWDQNTGVLQWETSFPHISGANAVLFFQINSQSKEITKIEVFPGKYAKVYIYSFTRASMKTSEKIDVPWYDHNTKCSFISSSYFICIENSRKIIQFLAVKDEGSFIAVPVQSFGMESDNEIEIISIPYQTSSETPVFALKSEKDAALLQIQPPGIKFIKNLPKINAITSTVIDNRLILFAIKIIPEVETTVFNIQAIDVESVSELEHMSGVFTLNENRGAFIEFYILPYSKKDHTVSYKMLFLFEDHSMLLIHHQGRMLWSREEALSSIISTEILDLPLSETDANIEQEFGDPNASLLSMFLTRIKSQIYLLQTFVLQALIGFKGVSENSGTDKNALARDTFGLHKVIVVLTKPGKAFGIDNLSGLIIWSHYEKGLTPFSVLGKPYLPLFVQRTTAHFPYPPVCTAVGVQTNSRKGRIYSFDPITGVTLESKNLPYEVVQIMPVGALNDYLREIFLLDSDLKVHTYPESHNIDKYRTSHYMFTADPQKGIMTGYSLKTDDGHSLKAIGVWKIDLPQQIIKVVLKKPQEHVHSQGRVMGDRSVLYKYLNPNLAAVFTEGNDVIQKSFCNVYLVDTITGLIVYSTSHKRCKTPIHAVHSENWLVYSFYNDKSRRVEISSIELFEGMHQSNTTAFSSFTPPPLPLVEHQTFIFPSSIEMMADTITERGMTSKHILIALPSGGILELPKTFLDPRRPINPLPEHREEGLIPYIPELPIMSEGIINYNQSIARVKGIITAPSALESTCLVFVHGLDLFYTRVTPSKTFDVLKDDFDHYLISVVLLGMLVLSYTTKRLAARKTLRAAWK